MNRQIASRQRKVMSQPPEQARGPVPSIASAQNFSNMQQQQQLQQQQLQQQQLQQQRQYQSQSLPPPPRQAQSQRRPPEPQGQAQQQRLPNGMPSQVTIPQAISVIVSRLNRIESRVANAPLMDRQGNEQVDDTNEIDNALGQLFERVTELETNQETIISKQNEYVAKMIKLENDLRESKDMIIRLQSFSIDTTNKLLSFSNNAFSNPSMGSSINSSTNSIVSLDEPLTVVIKEIIQNELVDNAENGDNN